MWAAVANLLPVSTFQPLPAAVSDSPADFYHQKTDAELQFLAGHPEHYHPDLIASAMRELRRRGVQPAAPAPAAPADPYAAAQPGQTGTSVGRLTLVAAAVLLVGLGAFYYAKPSSAPAAPSEPAPAATPKGPPRLTEVAMSVLPTFDAEVQQCIEAQLKRVPAAEQAAATQASQPLRQYRELAKRFWLAEAQTEFVLEQAHKKQFTPALPGHVEAVQAAWGQWNKAVLYSYKLGPAMTTHFDLMNRVAQQQQEGLADLYLVARDPQPFENEKTQRREADVNDLLSGLLDKSPVTGRPYRAQERRVRL